MTQTQVACLALAYSVGALVAVGFVVGSSDDPELAHLLFVLAWPAALPLAIGYLLGRAGDALTGRSQRRP